MTRRERVLVYLMGGTLAGLGLVFGLKWAVFDRIQGIKSDISRANTLNLQLTRELRNLDSVEADWQTLTGRTLGNDPKDAQLNFRRSLHRLLERHGLMLADTKMVPGAGLRDKAGFVRVPVVITTKGTLKEVAGFLCDFYRQDYYARLDRVYLNVEQAVLTEAMAAVGTPAGAAAAPASPAGTPATPAVDTGRVGGHRRPGNAGGAGHRPGGSALGPDGPVLNVSITATTLVAPGVDKLDSQANAQHEELPTGRLRNDLIAYNEIFEKSLFKPWQPAPPAPPPTPGACCMPDNSCQLLTAQDCATQQGRFLGPGTQCTETTCTTPPPPVPENGACCLTTGVCLVTTADACAQQQGQFQGVNTTCTPNPCPQPAPPRPNAEYLVLRMTEMRDGRPIAWVYDERNKTAEPQRYGLDDTIPDEGVVRLIHNRGMVIRGGEHGATADYYYKLGEPFAARVPLSESDYPEIVRALREEFGG